MAQAPTIEDLSGQRPVPEDNPMRAAPSLGRPGLKTWAGYISEEFIPELRGERAYKVYDEMRRNEPTIVSMLTALTSLLWMVDRTIEPVDPDNGADRAAADFVAKAMKRLDRPIEDVFGDIMTMFPFGWALLETTYKYDEGKIWWGSIDLRGQDSLFTWDITETGKIRGFTQMPAPSYKQIYIPEEKFLLFRTSAEKNNPEGISLLRGAYKPYFYKKVIEEVEAMGAERDLLGIPAMRVPFGATPDEIQQARAVIENIKNDDQAGIIETAIGPNPEDRFEFRLVTGQGSSGRVSFTDRLINRYSAEITMVALAQFLRLGTSGASAGYNLSSDQRDFFQVAVRGWLKRIESVWNGKAIPRLLAMNGMSGKCRMEHGRITQLNLQSIANFITSGVQNKWLTPTRDLENFLRRGAELPELATSTPAASEAAPEEDPVQKLEAAKAAQAAGAVAAATPTGQPGAAPAAAGGKPKDNSGITSMPGANQRGNGMTPAAAGAKVGLAPKAASEEFEDVSDADIWEEYTQKVVLAFAGDFWTD